MWRWINSHKVLLIKENSPRRTPKAIMNLQTTALCQLTKTLTSPNCMWLWLQQVHILCACAQPSRSRKRPEGLHLTFKEEVSRNDRDTQDKSHTGKTALDLDRPHWKIQRFRLPNWCSPYTSLWMAAALWQTCHWSSGKWEKSVWDT